MLYSINKLSSISYPSIQVYVVKKPQAWEMWPNGWPDWHQLWCTHADSSRKGSWPKKNSGGGEIGVRGWGGGGVGGQKFKSQKKHM